MKTGIWISAGIMTLIPCLFTGTAVAIPVLEKVHPGYDLVAIRPEGLQVQATGLDFMPDGRLMYTNYRIGTGHNYNMDGEIITLTGVERDDPDQVVVDTFASGFKDPMGLWVMGDSVYVVARDEFSMLYDSDGDGAADVRKVIMDDWTKGERMWSYGPVYYDGYFYLAHGVEMAGDPHGTSPESLRGCMLKVAPDGSYEVFAGGLRQPDGIAVNPVGDIFMVDGQGQWLPSCKLIHVQEGRFYGHDGIIHSATPWDETIPESPPAIWLDHGKIGNSNTQPVFLDTGLYIGQLLAADVTYGGIQRYFLEKVNGEYQGAVFQFTGGLECGMNTTRIGPDGAIYTGGIGDGGTGPGAWGWRHKRWGLQKLAPNGKAAFEMLAVRSLADGFEIEFTKAPGASAMQSSNYAIDRGGFSPAYAYGAGNMVYRHDVPILSVESGGGNKVVLKVASRYLEHDREALLESTCFHFTLSDVISAEGEELWSAEAWYTLNFIGPADKVGCMNNNYLEYDPAAVYDDGFRCVNLKSRAGRVHGGPMGPRLTRRITSGLYEIDISVEGAYTVQVADVNGKIYYMRKGTGMGTWALSPSRMKPGIHFIHLITEKGVSTERVLLY